MKLAKDSKLVFIGDSITDCDRQKPEGEGLFGALGKGYVSFVDAMLMAVYPELGIRVVNKGVSGNTVRDLESRWSEDVINQRPDWLSIMIGINDVWRQHDVPFIKEWHVYAQEYEATLRKLVTKTRPLVQGLVLMTPYYLEPNPNDKMRHMMDQYGGIVKKIADETEDVILIDTQAAFDKVMTELYSATLAWDRVHPSAAGHMVLARAFLSAVEFDWNRA